MKDGGYDIGSRSLESMATLSYAHQGNASFDYSEGTDGVETALGPCGVIRVGSKST